MINGVFTRIFLGILLCTPLFGQAQEAEAELPWSASYALSLADFKNKKSRIDPALSTVFLQSGATIKVGFSMNGVSFMFTKNFNDKVSCVFLPKTALYMAPDSTSATNLLALSQLDFDLSELYARKIRKALFEQKKTFSKANFFEPYFNKMTQERAAISARLYKETNFGKEKALLAQEHQKILQEIDQLSAFCQNCKPPKRKKK